MEIVLDSRLDELRHAAGARSAESKARWDARTAEVVSGLKTVVQARLRGIENERMGGRFESIERAYDTFAAKVRDVETGTSYGARLRSSWIGATLGAGPGWSNSG